MKVITVVLNLILSPIKLHYSFLFILLDALQHYLTYFRLSSEVTSKFMSCKDIRILKWSEPIFKSNSWALQSDYSDSLHVVKVSIASSP